MGQKVNPKIYRLPFLFNWGSRWFNSRKYKKFLREDTEIRQYIEENLKQGAIGDVNIERSANEIKIIIRTGRPGIIIGRGGEAIELLKKALAKKTDSNIRLEVEELSDPDDNATIVAQNVAEQIERRIPFRRVLSQTVDRIIQCPNIKGIKVCISGRLNGAEMSRTEWNASGKLPLQTIRAEIGFAKANAHTKYGIIGVKIWLYKGDKI